MTDGRLRVDPGRRQRRSAARSTVGLRSLLGGIASMVLVLMVPPVLVIVAGNPMPRSVPAWTELITAFQQHDLRTDSVIDGLSLVLWALWAQLALAVLWELAFEVPRMVGGRRRRPVPLLLRPVGGLASRLMAGLITLWASTVASDGSPAAASVVAESTDGPPGDPERQPGDPAPRVADPGVSDRRWPAAPDRHHHPGGPPVGPVGGRGELDQYLTDPWLWAGSAVLVLAALDAVERRRRFAASRRPVGAEVAPLDPHRRGVEHRLRRRADLEQAHWLTAAVQSLGSGGGWSPLPTPFWLSTVGGELVVRLAEPGVTEAPAPWSIGDDGLTCRLPTVTPIAALAGRTPNRFPTLVTVADQFMINLAAAGGLAVVGPPASTGAVIRSLVYELRYSALAGEVQIMAAPGVCPPDVEPLVAAVTESTASWASSAGEDTPPPPVVVVVTSGEAGSTSVRPATPPVDRSPAIFVVVGSDTPQWWTGPTLTVGDDRATIEPSGARPPGPPPPVASVEQLGTRSPASLSAGSPSLLSARSAADLELLMSDPGPRWLEPSCSAPGPGPTLRLLGKIEIEGVDFDLTSQQLSLISFLACAGSCGRVAIIDALWDGRTISESRFPNLLAEVRSKIGRHHLPDAEGGRYRLDGIATDLERFQAAITTAAAMPGQGDRILLEALGLVRGVPLTAPGARYWTWVADSSDRATRIEAMVTDTAYQLAQRFTAVGDLASAVAACRQGLLACPLDEHLVTVLADLHLELGRVDSARRLIDGWESGMRRLGCGEPADGPRARLGIGHR